MNSKVLIGGVIGGIAFFLLGYLMYGVLLGNAMAACTSCQRPMEEINFICLFAGNLFVGWAIAYIFHRWATISTFVGGATAGAILGLLLAIGFGSIGYATSTVYTGITCIIYYVIAEVIMWAGVGGVIGWWLGRK